MLKRLGVTVTYYDPLIGAGIAEAHHQEDEGRVHRVAGLADLRGAGHSGHRQGGASKPAPVVILDNTWATPLYFKPFAHGADVSIQAATKYIVGHADIMLGAITATEEDRGGDCQDA